MGPDSSNSVVCPLPQSAKSNGATVPSTPPTSIDLRPNQVDNQARQDAVKAGGFLNRTASSLPAGWVRPLMALRTGWWSRPIEKGQADCTDLLAKPNWKSSMTVVGV